MDNKKIISGDRIIMYYLPILEEKEARSLLEREERNLKVRNF
ncbi:hypothetical protein [Anoxybacter fermentans]|nr:hypothetical protein [Anoxybacter fermentans]